MLSFHSKTCPDCAPHPAAEHCISTLPTPGRLLWLRMTKPFKQLAMQAIRPTLYILYTGKTEATTGSPPHSQPTVRRQGQRNEQCVGDINAFIFFRNIILHWLLKQIMMGYKFLVSDNNQLFKWPPYWPLFGGLDLPHCTDICTATVRPQPASWQSSSGAEYLLCTQHVSIPSLVHSDQTRTTEI